MKHYEITRPIGLRTPCAEIEKACREAHVYRRCGLKPGHFIVPLGAGNGRTTFIEYMADMYKEAGVLDFISGIDDYIEITLDGKTEKKDVTIFSVGNGCWFGGGMKAVPHAKPDDGLFDVVIADRFTRPRILKMLMKFIPGKHTTLPGIREFRCSEITFRCPGMVLDVDGELIPMDEARYRILPAAAGVRRPER